MLSETYYYICKLDYLMTLFHFLVILQGTVAFGLVVTILMQRSEGGGLGVGGSPSGLMSARGAADFMTRMTSFLAILFVSLSVALAFVAAQQGTGGVIDDSFERLPVQAPEAPAEIAPQAPVAPAVDDPLAAAAAAAAASESDEDEAAQ